MMTQGTGAGTRARSGFGVLALLIVACAGKDTPPFADGFEQALAQNYGGDDGVGVAGAAGAAGAGGRGGAAGAGMVGTAGASMGGGAAGTQAAGGGSAGTGASGEVCDAFTTILLPTCGISGCHNAGSSQGAFAVTEADAADFVDEQSTFGAACGVFIDSRNPEESLILTKCNDTFDKANCGPLQMPLTGDFLTPDQEACVLSWLGQFAN
jgi:hypothetical protein